MHNITTSIIGRRFTRRLSVLSIAMVMSIPALADDDDDFRLREAKWESGDSLLVLHGRDAPRSATITVTNARSGSLIATFSANRKGDFERKLAGISPVPCRVRATAGSQSSERDVEHAPSNCDNGNSHDDDEHDGGSGGDGGGSGDGGVISGNFAILAANDLGMHCADQDYQIFSILPPYNVLNAQVVRKGSEPDILSPADGIEVVYSAIESNIVDPNEPNLPPIATDSITTTSRNDAAAGLYKSNFWQTNPASANAFGVDAYDNLYPAGLLGSTDFPLTADLGLPAPDVVQLWLGPDGVANSGDESLNAHQTPMPGIDAAYGANDPKPFEGFVENLPFFINLPIGYTVQGFNRFTAEGIPILPIDDQGREQTYPLMRVEARDASTHQVLAHVDVTVPVASEADCQQCHASQNVCGHQNSYTLICDDIANSDPAIAFVDADINGNFSESVPGTNPEQRVINAAKINILRLHDSKHGTTLDATRSVVCANCHYSPALDLAHLGPNDDNGKEQTQHISMSRAMHGFHGNLNKQAAFADLFPNMPAPDSATRDLESQEKILGETCYQCHPGKRSKCLRGAMGNGGIVCQDCHGQMAQVGNDFTENFPLDGSADLSKRVSWAEEPKCQSCHIGDVFQVAQAKASSNAAELIFNARDKDSHRDALRLHMAYGASAHLEAPGGGNLRLQMLDFADSRFASNMPLYRLSGGADGSGKGHNGMSCEGCHGSTHAIWPARNELASDNQNAIGLQGHSGPVVECSTCHEGDLGNTLDGPHGMHPVGSGRFANGGHEDMAERNPNACRACHGMNGEGTVLSRMSTTRTLECDDRDLPGCNSNKEIILERGTMVGCTQCHENEL
jgi:hypothetical protein